LKRDKKGVFFFEKKIKESGTEEGRAKSWKP
jgi:hypothetical protein